MPSPLLLITTNYPYTYRGGEVMFVAPEVQHLVRTFGALCVAPQHALGECLDVPPGVEIDPTLAQALARARVMSLLQALAWPGFWSELWRGLRCGGWIGGVRVWRWAALAQTTYRWAQRRFGAATPVLFYTYWRGGSTLALARLAREHAGTQLVTRVHRYELYEDSFDPPFQPWHPTQYHELALTVTISQDGFDYLRRSGVPANRLALSRLGTAACLVPAGASTDGVVRIVSCSFVIAVKRVPLIAQVLGAWARLNPARVLHWTHFGAGPELGSVEAALRDAPDNFRASLPGQVTNAQVMAHYAAEPVDAFVLLSASEGLPVSIQEAASAGIPVLATDVGGIREIVGDDNGVLLVATPTVDDAVAALERVLAGGPAMRAASLRRWAADFDAELNYRRFAQRLLELTRQPSRPE